MLEIVHQENALAALLQVGEDAGDYRVRDS